MKVTRQFERRLKVLADAAANIASEFCPTDKDSSDADRARHVAYFNAILQAAATLQGAEIQAAATLKATKGEP